ncbi:MAG: hypothetical protein AAF411_22845 [Myxococcota bacterium]
MFERILLLSLVLGCDVSEVDERPTPTAGSAQANHEQTALTQSAEPSISEPGRVEERESTLCTRLACAIGRSPDEVNLGLQEVRRVGRWVELEEGVWYQVRHGQIARLQLRPCHPLRRDFSRLVAQGFRLRNPRVVNRRDARGLRGIEGFWLEGRYSQCRITSRPAR